MVANENFKHIDPDEFHDKELTLHDCVTDRVFTRSTWYWSRKTMVEIWHMEHLISAVYWIEAAQKSGIISHDSVRQIFHDCGAIRRMLIASINTAKENN